MKYDNKNIRFIIVDSFCGFGGVTTGMENARDENGRKICKVIVTINHDPFTIESNKSNNQDLMYFNENIRKLSQDLHPLIDHVDRMKKLYPNAYLVFWSSLECTNFSIAKGGQPRDADSRTLAEHMHPYYEALDPEYIMIENVREFMSRGALDSRGKPISKDRGRDYLKWIKDVQTKNRTVEHYYDFDFKIMNAADYGAHTSRIRYFAIFAKKGLPIRWPQQTHAKNAGSGSLFQAYKKWRPVKEVLDFSDEGVSIFKRKKPLVDRTLQRIDAGLIKYVANGDKEWLMKYRNYSNGGVNPGSSTKKPAPTLCTGFNPKLVQTEFLSAYYSNGG